jgi:DHA1 family solute carrier family 18 vesicular amine transporter 1/2
MQLADLQQRVHTDATTRPDPRLLALLGTLFFVEAGLYSSITPLLTHYVRSLHLSQRALGPLSGAYAAGLIAGAICATRVGRRAGIRATLCLGLWILAGSSLAFGFASRIVLLDAMRFTAGIGAGFIWAAGIAWIVAVTPVERRGASIGAALGAGVAGTLLGPAIGVLAVGIGIEATFAGVAAIVALLAVATARVSIGAPGRTREAPLVVRTLCDFQVCAASWLLCLLGLIVGAVNVLAPLRLAHLGAGTGGVGAVFLIAAAVGGAVAPLAGRIVDRFGTGSPIRWGLVIAVVVLSLTPLAGSVVAVSVLTILAIGIVIAAGLSAGGTSLTRSVEGVGGSVVAASAMVMLCVSVGEALGPLLATALAHVSSDGAPLTALAGLSLATLVLFAIRRDAP